MSETERAAVAPRVLPPITPLNRPFWTGGATGQLMILRCRACRRWIHPQVSPCPYCGSAEIEAEAVSGRGHVFTYTVNRHRYNPEVPVPILIAIVELPEQEGLRFTTNVVDCDPEDLRIGMAVDVRFEPHGDVWVPVFAPATTPAA